jgi:hypothetical protein
MARTRVAVAFFVAFSSACAGQSPVAPTAFTEIGSPTTVSGPLGGSSGASSATSRMDVAGSPYGGNAIPLIEVSGSVPTGGSGTLNDPQTGEPGSNNFEVTVNMHGGPPNTDLYFQFVGDVVPESRGDGSCPAFPDPPANTIRILHTSPGGTVSTHVKFGVPEGAFFGAFDSGVKSDFAWRVVNVSQTFDLRTPCVVLTGK